MSQVIAHTQGDQVLTRGELAVLPTPAGTATHRPIPHIEIVQSIIESLDYRKIAVVSDSYAVDKSGAKMFGTLNLETQNADVRFSLGLRNSHDKSMKLSMVAGYNVFVCTNMAFSGDFTPILHKHTKNFDLKAAIAVGVDQVQRNFEPLSKQISAWKAEQITDATAKLIIYRAFIEQAIELPHHLDRKVHELYFEPIYPEFAPRTLWSLSNAFTSAFKELDPIPQYRATAGVAKFLDSQVSDIRVASIEPLVTA
jgi:hypothetical protein